MLMRTSLGVPYGDGRAGLARREDERGVDPADEAGGADAVEQEVLELGDAADGDLEEEVLLAGDVVALDHLGQVVDEREELAVEDQAMAPQRDVNEGQRGLADERRVDDSHVLPDDPALLELLDALEHGGRRGTDRLGQ